MPGEELTMIVIYYRPRDLPWHNYVARQFFITPDGPVPAPGLFATRHSLAEIRATIPGHMACLARDPTDDPAIVESWI